MRCTGPASGLLARRRSRERPPRDPSRHLRGTCRIAPASEGRPWDAGAPGRRRDTKRSPCLDARSSRAPPPRRGGSSPFRREGFPGGPSSRGMPSTHRFPEAVLHSLPAGLQAPPEAPLRARPGTPRGAGRKGTHARRSASSASFHGHLYWDSSLSCGRCLRLGSSTRTLESYRSPSARQPFQEGARSVRGHLELQYIEGRSFCKDRGANKRFDGSASMG